MVAVGHDSDSNFEAYIWLYKVGAPKIKLNTEDWNSLMSLKDEAEIHFRDRVYTYRQYTVRADICVSFVESYGKRLICVEHVRSVSPNNDKPNSSVK